MATAGGEGSGTLDDFTGEQGNQGDQGFAEPEGHETSTAARQYTEQEWAEWNSWWYQHQRWGATHPAAPVGPAESNGDSQLADRSRDPWTSWDPWASWSHDHHWDHKPWWKTASSKPDYSDPPAWPGWGHYRLWKKSIRRWNDGTDVPQWKRIEKLLRTLDWDMQSKFEHFEEAELQGPQYLDVFFGVLDVLAGEKETTEMRRAIRAALYEGNRKSDESLSQYSLRRESQFSQAARYLNIPDNLKGFMLEEPSGLSKQGLQSLRVLTGGASDYDAVRKALKVMDVEEETICKGKPPSYFQDNNDASAEHFVPADEDVSEEGDLLDTDAVDDVFFAIQHMSLDEDEALSFVADWQKRRRSWSENKELKNAMKKDRRHFDEPTSRAPRDPAPPHRRKKNIAELKRITRCAKCGEKGHWRAECDKPNKPRSEVGKNMNAFAYLGSRDTRSSAPASSSAASLLANFGAGHGNFMSIPPGLAIVDPGAAQDLIGEKAFCALRQRLAQFGLKPVILDEDPPTAAGIGGSAKPLYNALAPVFLGGVPGVVKLTVLAEEVPQLLSIGLLEHTKALIDTDSNQITFKALSSSAPMQRLESGHRALDIVRGAGKFKPPEEVLQQFGLEANAFEAAIDEQYFGCQTDQGGKGRKIRSEADQEYWQAKWFQLVLKLLTMKRGTFNIPLPVTGPFSKCAHPEEHRVKGANQYGTWSRCLLCKAKVEYIPYGPDNPKPTSKKSKENQALPKAEVAKAKAHARQAISSVAASSSTPVTRAELQETLSQHSQELAATLSQTLMPLIQNQAQLQNQVGYAMQALEHQAGQTAQMPMTPHPQAFEIYDQEMENPNGNGELGNDDW
eukprot:s1227_g8.t1